MKQSHLVISELQTMPASPFTSHFIAHTGEFIAWFYFGTGNQDAEFFWTSFIKIMGIWSQSLPEKLSETVIPQTPQELHKTFFLMEQSAQRMGKAIFAFDRVDLLADDLVRKFIWNLACAEVDGITVILADQENVDIGRMEHVRASRLTNRTLQFNREELRIYYTALGIVIDSAGLQKIWEITKGWAGTTYLLARYLQRRELVTDAGIDNAVMFVYEVFMKDYMSGYKKRTQRALVLLSLLDEFSMQLAVDLTDLTAEDLMELVEVNDMIRCRRTSGYVSFFFQYLYQSYLETRWILVSKEERFSFYSKAARWYGDRGLEEQALKYFTACGEYDNMLPFLRKRSLVKLPSEQVQIIWRILERVPGEYIETHPEHRLYKILAGMFSGQKEEMKSECKALLESLEEKERIPQEDRVLGESYILRSYLLWDEHIDQAFEDIKRACRLLPNGSNCLSFNKILFRGRKGCIAPGMLSRMADIFLKCIPYMRILFPGLGVGAFYLAAAEIYTLQMKLDEASLKANAAILEAGTHDNRITLCEANFLQLRINMMVGELDDLLFYCEQIQTYGSEQQFPPRDSIVSTAWFRLYTFLGIHQKIDDQVKQDPLKDPQYASQVYTGEQAYIHALYLALVAKLYRPALSYIDTILAIWRKREQWLYELNLVILKSIIYEQLDSRKNAMLFFMQAYKMIGGNGIVFPFAEYAEYTIELIASLRGEIKEEQIPAAWLDKVLICAEKYSQRRRRLREEYLKRYQYNQFNLLDQLSPKEYKTLKLLCKGCSIETVSEKLGVKKQTLYSYLYRICTKLHVKDKAAAIHFAKREGILGEDE